MATADCQQRIIRHLPDIATFHLTFVVLRPAFVLFDKVQVYLNGWDQDKGLPHSLGAWTRNHPLNHGMLNEDEAVAGQA